LHTNNSDKAEKTDAKLTIRYPKELSKSIS